MFHRDPDQMARVLVGYIACDKRVQSAIRSQFISSPSLSSIAKIRAARVKADALFSRGAVAKGADYQGWDWRGEKYADRMERTSERFVAAMNRERNRSGSSY